MKLVHASASPFVRKVMVVLAEANKTDAVELIDGFGSPVAPNENALAANPVGKIPCLLLDNGKAVYDSRVITRYLSEQFELLLYPGGERGLDTMTLEAHADAILDAAVLCVYEARCREENERSDAWVKAQHSKINNGLDALEKHWLDFLESDLTIAHIGVACALEYLDFRQALGAWADWRPNRSGLANWCKDFGQRPSMVSTVPS